MEINYNRLSGYTKSELWNYIKDELGKGDLLPFHPKEISKNALRDIIESTCYKCRKTSSKQLPKLKGKPYCSECFEALEEISGRNRKGGIMRKMKEHNKTLRLLRKLRRFSGDKIYAVLSERLIHPYLSDMRTELKALNEFQEIANLEGETLRKAIEEFMQEF